MTLHQNHHTTTRAAIGALLLALAATFGAQPAPASAAPAPAPRTAPTCPGNVRPTPAGACISQVDRKTVCAWPAQVDGRRVTVCTRGR